MKPIEFPQQNLVLKGPPGMPDVQDLPAYRAEDGTYFVSKWELTDADIEEIRLNRCLWLWIFAGGHPPVTLDTRENPFPEQPGSDYHELEATELDDGSSRV